MGKILMFWLAIVAFSSLYVIVLGNVVQRRDQGGQGGLPQQSSILSVTYKLMEDVFELKNEIRLLKDENKELRNTVAELQNRALQFRNQDQAMASPVAFYAVSSVVNNSYAQTGNGVPLILNRVVHESSRGLYNTGTGKFTTPERGYYVFTFSVSVTKTTKYGLVVRVGYSYGRYNVAAQTRATVADGQEAKAVTGTVILLLPKGTEVWLDTHNPAEVRINECWFAGWLHQKN